MGYTMFCCKPMVLIITVNTFNTINKTDFENYSPPFNVVLGVVLLYAVYTNPYRKGPGD